MFKPTDEQQQLIKYFQTGESLKVEACAGSGKTSTLMLFAKKTRKKCLYIAFNRAIADEAAAKFPKHVLCKTAHSLAWDVGKKYQPRFGRATPKNLVKSLGLPRTINEIDSIILCRALLGSINIFCQSADKSISIKHMPVVRIPEYKQARFDALFVRHISILWKKMCDVDSDIPVSHDFYLKLWALSEPSIAQDIVFFDEAQDANPMMLALVEGWRAKGAQIIYVGDRYQQIYSWRGAVNAMSTIETPHTGYLTRSFRYGQPVANLANAILIQQRDVSSDIKGDTTPCVVNVEENNQVFDALLCRTNAQVIKCLVYLLEEEQTCAISGGVGELFGMIKGARELKRGKRPVGCPELVAFDDWDELERFAQTELGQDLNSFINLVERYGLDELGDMVNQVKNNSADTCDVLLSTAHKSKGLEFERVKLACDYPTKFDSSGDRNPRWSEEEAHLLYVAVTRAIHYLDISDCQAAMDAFEFMEQAALEATEVSQVSEQALEPEQTLEPEQVGNSNASEHLNDEAYQALATFAATHGLNTDDAVHYLLKSYANAAKSQAQTSLF